jgi:hypothetical protein
VWFGSSLPALAVGLHLVALVHLLLRVGGQVPNPSFERTSLSWPRRAVVDHALRGQPKAAAQLKR